MNAALLKQIQTNRDDTNVCDDPNVTQTNVTEMPPTPLTPSNNTIDKKTKTNNRIRAIDELISTEETYVKNLDLLIELFCIPLETNKLIKANQIPTIFSEIKTIVQLNKNLLATLKKNKIDDKIGEAMMEFVPYFKMYSNYVNNHEKASQLLINLTQKNQNNKLSKFLNEQQIKANGHSLQSFLILPIQRIPRYELCLKEIIKRTDNNNSDLNNLKLCYDKVCEVNKSINDRVHDFESRKKVRAVERRFDTKITLVSPSRKYIREGIMTKICRKKDVKYLFILFSDLLIYAEETENKKNQLKLHNILEFDIFFKIKLNNNRIYGNKCFEIYSTRKSFLCVCENENIRDEWYNDIKQETDTESNKRENRRITEIDIRSQEEFIRILDVAPIWIPDDFTDNCMNINCNKKFTLTRRRHHCRYCGAVICGGCSKNQLPHFLPDKRNKTVRVCINCYEHYKIHFPDFDADFDDIAIDDVASNLNSTKYGWDDDYDELDAAIRKRYNIQYVADENDEVIPDENYYDEVEVIIDEKEEEEESIHQHIAVEMKEINRIPSEEVVSDIDEDVITSMEPMDDNNNNKKKKKNKKKRKDKKSVSRDKKKSISRDKRSMSKDKKSISLKETSFPFVLNQNEVEKAMKSTYRVGTICRIHSMKDKANYNNKYCRIIGFRKSQKKGDIDIYYVKILDKYWDKMNLYKSNVLKVKNENELNNLKEKEKKCILCSCFVFLFILALISILGGVWWYFFWKKNDGYYYYGPFLCAGIGVFLFFTSFWQYLKSKFCCLCCNCCYIKSNRVICC